MHPTSSDAFARLVSLLLEREVDGFEDVLDTTAQLRADRARNSVVLNDASCVAAVWRVLARLAVVMNEEVALVDERVLQQLHAQLDVRRATQVVTHGNHTTRVV